MDLLQIFHFDSSHLQPWWMVLTSCEGWLICTKHSKMIIRCLVKIRTVIRYCIIYYFHLLHGSQWQVKWFNIVSLTMNTIQDNTIISHNFHIDMTVCLCSWLLSYWGTLDHAWLIHLHPKTKILTIAIQTMPLHRWTEREYHSFAIMFVHFEDGL